MNLPFPPRITQQAAPRPGGISWLSAVIGILVFAVLNLVITLLVPHKLAGTTGATVVTDTVAAVLAIVLAPFLLRTFDAMQQKVTRQNNELQSLHAIDSAISSTLDLQTVLTVAIKEVTLAVDGELGALWLFSDDSPWPQPTAQAFYNLTPGMQQALTERVGAGPTDLARRTGVTQRKHGLEETWRTDRAAAALKLRNVMVVPIKKQDSVLGVMLVGNRGGSLNPLHGFADEDQTLLETISATVAVAVENARLYHETARRDEILRSLIARTGDAIAASSDAPLLMQILADEAARILPCRRVAVYRYLEEARQFQPLAAHDDEAARDETEKGRALLRGFFDHPLDRDVTALSAAVTSDQAQPQAGGADLPAHYVVSAPAALGLDPKDAAFLAGPGYVFVLRSRDRRGLGLLCLLDPSGRLRSPDVAGFAQTLAAQASVALENAQLAQQTQDLLARSQALQAAANQIAAELDPDRVLEGVVGIARRELDADGYALWNQDAATGTWSRRAATGLAWGGTREALDALLSGVFTSRVPQANALLPDGPLRALLALPLLYAGRATGVLTLSYAGPRSFTPDEIGLAQSFANQTASALENARLFAELRALYAREKRIAEDLQKSLLPDVPGRVGAFELDKVYQAALEEAVIGGDFFDLFPLGGDALGIVMADVSGKGLKAAVQTALLKYTLRAFALENPHDPATVLARVNDVLCSPMSSHDGFVTLFYGVLDTQTGALVYSNAGHEPPLCRRAGAGIAEEMPSCDGLALGAMPGVPYEECSTTLAPGDLLLLYTDGLTEARAPSGLFLGGEGLARLLPLADVSATDAVHSVYDQVAEFAADVRRDDVAMLALRRVPEGAA